MLQILWFSLCLSRPVSVFPEAELLLPNSLEIGILFQHHPSAPIARTWFRQPHLQFFNVPRTWSVVVSPITCSDYNIWQHTCSIRSFLTTQVFQLPCSVLRFRVRQVRGFPTPFSWLQLPNSIGVPRRGAVGSVGERQGRNGLRTLSELPIFLQHPWASQM